MTFAQRLHELGFKTYVEYLESDLWIGFRRRWRRSDVKIKFCMVCGVEEVELHHTTYERLGSERYTDVMPLCRVHHEQVHHWLKKNGKGVADSIKAVNELTPCHPVPDRVDIVRESRNVMKCESPRCSNTARRFKKFCRPCMKRAKYKNAKAVKPSRRELADISREKIKAEDRARAREVNKARAAMGLS